MWDATLKLYAPEFRAEPAKIAKGTKIARRSYRCGHQCPLLQAARGFGLVK